MKFLLTHRMKRGVFYSLIFAGIVLSVSGVKILMTDDNKKNQQPGEINNQMIEPIALTSPVQPPAPIELPFGGTTVLPQYRFVALYGSPAYPKLGSLGEQGLDDTVKRARELASQYQSYSSETVIPTFEIIATVASADVTENNDYSRELSLDSLRPYIDKAKDEKMYVILDLQPGRSAFFDQIKQYEELLIQPHVGIALDPEWRLRSEQDRHLKKVGSVTAGEVQHTYDWLADLVATHKLPQKLFVVHQFKPSMIEGRETLHIERTELAFLLHMDGYGTLGQKIDTWNTVQQNLPTNAQLAWKNFFDEDKPTPTPEQTMQQTPKPWLITYQ